MKRQDGCHVVYPPAVVFFSATTNTALTYKFHKYATKSMPQRIVCRDGASARQKLNNQRDRYDHGHAYEHAAAGFLQIHHRVTS